MGSPTSFRQAPKQQERLLDPEAARTQNEALARQVERAEMASLRAQQMRQEGYVDWNRRGSPSIPWRYLLPIGVGFTVFFGGPWVGLSTGRSLLIGVLSALILVTIIFVQDASRWLKK